MLDTAYVFVVVECLELIKCILNRCSAVLLFIYIYKSKCGIM